MVERFDMDMLTKEPNQIEMFYDVCSEALRKSNKPIILFGAGILGTYYLEFIKKIDAVKEILFCDNNPAKWGTTLQGLPVISFNELKEKYNDSYIIIASLNYYHEILSQLVENGLKPLLDPSEHNVFVADVNFFNAYKGYRDLIEENIDRFSKVYSLLCDEYSKELFSNRLNFCISANSKYITPFVSKSPQYFESGIITLSQDEILIDGGAYNGDTVEEFLKLTKGSFKKIYSFEPEKSKHEEFVEKFTGYENIRLMPYGLWDKKGSLRFCASNDVHSGISESGDTEIPVISIDEVLDGEPVSFIKMDIEGAELEALKGAVKTIKKYKPKLAICVYHKPLDIVDIPLYIKEIMPEYNFYLRHYNDGAAETVCYAMTD